LDGSDEVVGDPGGDIAEGAMAKTYEEGKSDAKFD